MQPLQITYICFPEKISLCCWGGIPSFSSTRSLILSTLSVGSISISICILHKNYKITFNYYKIFKCGIPKSLKLIFHPFPTYRAPITKWNEYKLSSKYKLSIYLFPRQRLKLINQRKLTKINFNINIFTDL